MIVDGGTSLDSRQEIDGDPRSETTSRALAICTCGGRPSSPSSAHLQSAGHDAFAAIAGKRSITERQADGRRRTSLRKSARWGGHGRGGPYVRGYPLPMASKRSSRSRRGTTRATTWSGSSADTLQPAGTSSTELGIKELATVVVETTGTWKIFDEFRWSGSSSRCSGQRLHSPEPRSGGATHLGLRSIFRRSPGGGRRCRPADTDHPRGPFRLTQ